jgi:purine-binding chemotaxis protein CheW
MNRKSRMKSTLDSLFSTNRNQAETPENSVPTLPQKKEAEKPREKVEVEKKQNPPKAEISAAVVTKPSATAAVGAAGGVKRAEKKPAAVKVKEEKIASSEKQPEKAIPQIPVPVTESKVEAPKVEVQVEKPAVEQAAPIAQTVATVSPEKIAPEKAEINVENYSKNGSGEKEVSDEEEHLVVFLLANEAFGIEIHAVESIIKKQLITKVPHAQKFILGVTNLRGTVVPVVDLRERFALPMQEATRDTRIIVLNTESGKDGILVDEVTEVMRIPKSAISPTPMITTTVNSTFIKGIARTDDRLIILLDVNTILA